MNVAQLKQAREIAMERLLDGEHPETLVHVLYYPFDYDYELAEAGIMGLSTGLPPGTDLVRSGYSSTYYTLTALVELANEILDH